MLLGLAISVTLWWSYFDVVAPVAERVLTRAQGEDRAWLARDSFTYLHFPMVVGIVFLAFGMKKVVNYVADTSHHELSDPLATVPLVALYGGVALYLLAHICFRLRNVAQPQPAAARPSPCCWSCCCRSSPTSRRWRRSACSPG